MDFGFSSREEDGRHLTVGTWRLSVPARMIASAPLGGGLGIRQWVLNAQVPISYGRLDPATHLAELAAAAGLEGPGVGLLTAVDVGLLERSFDDGVEVAATVGLDEPVWAASRCDSPGTGPAAPGTLNIVAWLPVRLSDAAMVNAVATVTEAKTQALLAAGIDGTGTATDAVCVACPPAGDTEAFAGPRSRWGSRLARAVHTAVSTGADSHCSRAATSVAR